MNAREIQRALALRYGSPFFARRQLAVLPNVSWAFLDWEADLLVMTKTGYLTEVEIKVSLQDWKADFEKRKWKQFQNRSPIKYFYYAAPQGLAERYSELQLPPGAGVILVPPEGSPVKLRRAEARPVAALTFEQQHRLLRLAAIKAWGLFHKPIKCTCGAQL